MGPISYLAPAPIPQTTNANSPLSECAEHILKANIHPKTAQQQARSFCKIYPLYFGLVCHVSAQIYGAHEIFIWICGIAIAMPGL